MPDTMGTLLGQSRTRPSLHSRLTWLIPALGESVWTRLPATITLLLFLKKFYFILERPGFDPWVGKIPWRSARQPTPVFLPGESPWTEEPGGLQSAGFQSQTRLSDWAQHSTQLTNNAVWVSGVQQSDSGLYIYTQLPVLFKILFPFGLL